MSILCQECQLGVGCFVDVRGVNQLSGFLVVLGVQLGVRSVGGLRTVIGYLVCRRCQECQRVSKVEVDKECHKDVLSVDCWWGQECPYCVRSVNKVSGVTLAPEA